VLKQELHPVGERTVKKHKIIIDGKKLKESEFATELAGTMGAIASANMYSVVNLITMIEQKDQEITQLQDRLKESEKMIGWGIQKGLEQARLKDIRDIQKLNENLTEAKQMIQITQEQVQELGNENKSLQNKIISITNQVIEIDQFKNKASEIYVNIEEEQQKVFCNLEIIQNYYQESKRSMDKAVQKEREGKAVRNSFQKIITALQKEETGKSQNLSISEQLKGDAMIKVWETNLESYKRITKGVNEDCQKIFDFIEKESTHIGTDGFSDSLGEIDINRYQLKTKEEFEEKKVEISNIKMVNMAEIEKLMIAPSSRLEKVKSTEKTIATQLPGLQRNFFSFEANEIPEAPKALVNFLEKHVQAVEADKESSPTQS
jgi:DNA repair exonuclease SbcCD ATPase subunit